MAEKAVPRANGTGTADLNASLKLLEVQLKKLKAADAELSAPLEEAVEVVQAEIELVISQTEELSSFSEEALQQAERLKAENVALKSEAERLKRGNEAPGSEGKLGRRASEGLGGRKDSSLQKTLAEKDKIAQQATDKLRAAERQIKSLSSQLSELRGAYTKASEELERLKDAQNSASANPALPSSAASSGTLEKPSQEATGDASTPRTLEGLGNEHATLAARLLGSGAEKLDAATVAAAAAGLRDTSVLEQQLKRARYENERLQKEIQGLNDTVFSKSFKAPSAWAEREVKYKMEKRAWEQQVAELQEELKTLAEENRGYRESNKAAEFEEQAKGLRAEVAAAVAEKVAAQQALHELQLHMREVAAQQGGAVAAALHRGRADNLPEDAIVHNLISAMEGQGIGTQQPRSPKQGSALPRRLSEAFPRPASSPDLEAFPVVGANLQEVIDEYDDRGIRIAGPQEQRRAQPRKRSDSTGPADASAGEIVEDGVSVDLEHIRQGLRADAAKGRREGGDGEPSSVHRTWSMELQEGGSTGARPGFTQSQQPMPAGATAVGEISPDVESGLPSPDETFRRLEAAGGISTLPGSSLTSGGGKQYTPSAAGASVAAGAPAAAGASVAAGAPAAAGASVAAGAPAAVSAPVAAGAPAAAGAPVAAGASVAAGAPAAATSSLLQPTTAGSEGQPVAGALPSHPPQASPASGEAETTAAERYAKPHADSSIQPAVGPGATQQGESSAAGARGGVVDSAQSPPGTSGQKGAASGVDDSAPSKAQRASDGASGGVSEIEPLYDSIAAPLGRIRSQKDPAVEVLTRGSSGGDSPWTQEKLRDLAAEKQSVEAELRENLNELDVGALKYRAVELASRVEMHESQIVKLQLALEQADQEKARLEEDLEQAMAAAATASKSLSAADQRKLGLIRERMRKADPLGGSQRLQEVEAALQAAHRELAAMTKQREQLARQLGSIASKIGAGVVPAASDLELPPGIPLQPDENTPPGEAGESTKVRRFKSFIGGLSDEEVEVMTLREENEAMMDTLVRTKVELAETQGDYLKMRRALIRSVEKQAALRDRLDSVREAHENKDVATLALLVQAPPADSQQAAHRGDIESLGERVVF